MRFNQKGSLKLCKKLSTLDTFGGRFLVFDNVFFSLGRKDPYEVCHDFLMSQASAGIV